MTMFLEPLEPRDLVGAYPSAVRPEALFLGRGDGPLEVAQFSSVLSPSRPLLRELHHLRQGKRATAVLIVVVHGAGRAALAARFGEDWAIHEDLDAAQVERISAAALDAPDRHAADTLVRQKLMQLAEQPIPGLRNSGLFALHELEHGVPARADWATARSAAEAVLSLRGRSLVEGLGFTIETLPGPASVLRGQETRVAIAVFLERSDEIEPANVQYNGISPVSYALAKADAEKLDYVIVTAGTLLRVYPVPPGVGTARRGRTETFVELDVALLDAFSGAYLPLLASAGALQSGGAFSQILTASKRFASDLGARLRDRVYADVMPALCAAFVRARRLRHPSRETLAETFQMALLTLFRLLFVAYAEDKELLPYHTNATYRDKALKTLAQRLQREQDENANYGSTTGYWDDVRQIWQAVDEGNHAWGVPPYNGGLFASDAATKSGHLLAQVSLPDSAFALALRALLLDVTAEHTVGPVDFRALGVREFGTIYEGLLEQELSVADQDLSVNAEGAYIPATTGGAPKGRARARSTSTEVVVPAGDVYLHDRSGARKSSGAYYTKDFAVEHLLERALEPALAEHCARLDAVYDDLEAADNFFDFHVADIAMGSGHFLVAAVDHIERSLADYLAKRPLAGVRNELARLRRTAEDALGVSWRGEPIEDTQLLRRQIARRCVHGVDLNPLAVELSRLSLWIHTFVPGLPLSFLDATLVCGNALVGIATFQEARELLGAEAGDLFAFTAEDLIAKAREPLSRLAKLSEATAAEVKDARKYYSQAKTAVASTDDLFTVLAASRVDDGVRAALESRQLSAGLKRGDLFAEGLIRKAEKALSGLRPLHFPTAFPQVFDRPRPGFDVILGNPPWEKLHVEEHEFWARHYPGFRGLTQSERERRMPDMRRQRPDLVAEFEREREAVDALRKVLIEGPFPGMGSGHPDLYKAFCWRFWFLLCGDGGMIGVVLPRAVFAAKGSEDFRHTLFEDEGHADLTTLQNRAHWVFDNVDARYTFVLAALQRGRSMASRELVLSGPYASRIEFERRRVMEPARFKYEVVSSWSVTAAVPLVSSRASADVFLKLRASVSFGDQACRKWKARPLQGDVNAASQKSFFDFENNPTKGRWPVWGGESFDVWTPDTGKRYAVAESAPLCDWLFEKRLRSAARREGAFAEFPETVISDPLSLPCRTPRIAFRDVTRATDTRTVRVALVPPKVFLTHKAPFLLFPSGTEGDKAFVLGIFSSRIFDWYARRFVETTLTFELLSTFPVPLEDHAPALSGRVRDLAARLAVQADERFEEWAAALGVVVAPLAQDEKDDLIAELDASVAHLYGLDEADLAYVFETFHEGWDFSSSLDATRRHFERLFRYR